MAIIPRLRTTLPNQVEGAQEYAAASNDTIRNFGKGPLPEQMSGENLEHTALLPAEAGRKKVTYKSDTVGEKRYEEPPMPYSGSNSSSVWQTRYGGCFIELSGRKDGEEFINIVHSSGTHISIDQNGAITMKSFGDTNNVTEGNIREVAGGSKDAVYEGGYTIHVQGGTCDIRSEGNMNISTGGDMTLSSGGKMTLNSSDALDLAASKIAFSSRVDTLDIFSTGILRIGAASDVNIKSGRNIFMESTGDISKKAGKSIISSAADNIFNKSGALLILDSAGKMSFKAGGIIAADGTQIQLANGLADGTDAAPEASTAFLAAVPPEPSKSIFTQNTVSATNPPMGVASIDESKES